MTGVRDLIIPQNATFDEQFRRLEPRFIFEAIVAGTSGAAEPLWPSDECSTIVDGTITWIRRDPFDPRSPTANRVECWLPSRAYAEGDFVHPLPAPVDLTGFTARMQIRDKKDDATGIILLTLTEVISADGIIAISATPTDGIFDIIIEQATTEAFTFKTAFYDLILTSPVVLPNFPNGKATRILEGKAKRPADVTKP